MTMHPITQLRAFYFVLLTFSLSSTLHAQEERRPQFIRPLGFYDHLSLPSPDSSKCRIDINYKIASEFFIFVRSLGNPNDFVARGEISAEILKSKSQSVARNIRKIELHRSEASPPRGIEGKSIEGSFSFLVEPGEYRILFQGEDFESARRMPFPSPEIKLKKLTKSEPGISDILIVDRIEKTVEAMRKVYPLNLGGDARFGKRFYAVFQTVGFLDSQEPVRYLFYKVGADMKRTNLFSDSLQADDGLSDHFLVVNESDSSLSYSFERGDTTAQVKTYLVHIPSDTLEPGKYGIELKGPKNSVSRKLFELRWVDMPRTLMNFVIATEALQPLMSDREFDEFISKAEEERKKQFVDFWKKRDPTASTAYNEAMAEYYRRCDFAIENYSTLREPNGIKTDRGKVYVLYGAPSKIDRTMTPGNPPLETWYYENLAKKFLFIDESKSGNYKLLSSEKL